MDPTNEPVDAGITRDDRVVDTHGNILAKMARDRDPSRARELGKLDELDAEMVKYSAFLFNYLHDTRSALERVYRPYDERDWSFKARVDMFLDADLSNDIEHAIPPNKIHTFSADQFPGYKEENIIFLKFPYAMVHRWSPGEELSYLHAPTLVQHYALAINTGRKAPILDATAYVKSYQGAMVWKHIEGMTFESESTLRHLLLPGKQLLNSTNTAHHIVQYLREHHVGLVSRFRVFPEFKDPNRFHYHGSVKKNHSLTPELEAAEEGSLDDCRHAMCLVGKKLLASIHAYMIIELLYLFPCFTLFLTQGIAKSNGQGDRITISCCKIAGATSSSSRWTSAI